jgi:hypothetical protein
MCGLRRYGINRHQKALTVELCVRVLWPVGIPFGVHRSAKNNTEQLHTVSRHRLACRQPHVTEWHRSDDGIGRELNSRSYSPLHSSCLASGVRRCISHLSGLTQAMPSTVLVLQEGKWNGYDDTNRALTNRNCSSKLRGPRSEGKLFEV